MGLGHNSVSPARLVDRILNLGGVEKQTPFGPQFWVKREDVISVIEDEADPAPVDTEAL